MNDSLTLVIMAAGMGSRFGGLKQIEPVGPNGEFMIDYSIYDAIKAGFKKVVFIIKEENFEIFKETIGARVEQRGIEVAYAFQKQDTIPEGYTIPEDRVKPWGTSHAILSAKDYVDGDFLVLNADDFYGRDPFMKAAQFANENDQDCAIIVYHTVNTLTENGAVKRGVCNAKDDGYLSSITESSIEMDANTGVITASPLDGSPSYEVSPETPVSMNLFFFRHKVFDELERRMPEFFEKNKDNLSKCEYLIPETVSEMMNDGTIKVKVIPTTSRWLGVTYKEDKPGLVSGIQERIDAGEYDPDLWSTFDAHIRKLV